MSAEDLQGKTILAIGAHPDDIEFGCGGVLLKEARNGSHLHLLVCSHGESGTNGTPAVREAEARKAAEQLGANISFIDLGGDAQMTFNVDNANKLARAIREIQPDIVLAPSTHQNQHPDHAIVGALARNACRLARYGNLEVLKPLPKHSIESLYFYLISNAELEANGSRILVDISEVVEEWKTLMDAHQSQMKTRNYVELQISKARSLGLSAGVEYAAELSANDPIITDTVSGLPRAARSL